MDQGAKGKSVQKCTSHPFQIATVSLDAAPRVCSAQAFNMHSLIVVTAEGHADMPRKANSSATRLGQSKLHRQRRKQVASIRADQKLQVDMGALGFLNDTSTQSIRSDPTDHDPPHAQN
jgi:hypothetical protein